MADIATTLREQSLARDVLAAVAPHVLRGGAQKAATIIAQALARYRVELHAGAAAGGDAPALDLACLSLRELEVVGAVCGGLRLREIAMRLCISHHTARNHLKHAFRKLRVNSQIELVAAMRGALPQAVAHLQEAVNGPRS